MSQARTALAAYTTAFVVRTAAAVALPAVASWAVAAMLRTDGSARSVTTPALLALGGCLAALALADTVAATTAATAVARRTAALRVRLVDRLLLLRRPPDMGDSVTRVVHASADAARMPVGVVTTVVSLAGALASVVAIWWTDWLTGLAFTSTLPALLLVTRGPLRKLSAAQARYLQAQTHIAGRLLAVLTGARTVRASGTAARETARTLDRATELSAAGRSTWDAQRALVFHVRLAATLVELVTLTIAGLAVAGGRLAPAALIAVLGYTTLALGGIEQIDTVAELAMAGASRRRVQELLSREVPTEGASRLTGASSDVTWAGVGIDGALHDIDLHLPTGTSLALVGASGSGKSVLAATVGRLVSPDTGRVTLGGIDVDTAVETDLRRTVGYAFDTPALLGATVAEVIAWPDPREDVDVRAAAVLACADAFVRRLPNGYDTLVADAPLSGGERQRLGLARALAHPVPVLVLDDAASGLDAATAADVRRALIGAAAGRTLLVAAHHVDTAAACDRVAWLDGGRLRRVDTHARLWDDPHYRALFGVDELGASAA